MKIQEGKMVVVCDYSKLHQEGFLDGATKSG
jgi:hypothetical protein